MKPTGKTGWIARILGGLSLILLVVFVIGSSVDAWENAVILFVYLPVAVMLAGYIIAWPREMSGGLLIILGYALFCLSPTVYGAWNESATKFYWQLPAFLVPLLACGLLFIISSRRRAGTS